MNDRNRIVSWFLAASMAVVCSLGASAADPTRYKWLDLGSGANDYDGSVLVTDYVPDLGKTRIEMGFWMPDATWNENHSAGLFHASGLSSGGDSYGRQMTASYLFPKPKEGDATKKRYPQVGSTYDVNGEKSFYGIGDMTKFHTIVMDGPTMTFDGVVVTGVERGTEKASGPLVVGAMMWGDKNLYTAIARMKISYLKIYESGVLVRDYYPAKNGNTAALYDAKNGNYLEPTKRNWTTAPSVGDDNVPADATPYTLNWKGGAASQNWTTTGNWESVTFPGGKDPRGETYLGDNGAYPLTGGCATFKKTDATMNVTLNTDVTIKGALFDKGTKTMITGGHALKLEYAEDNVLDIYHRLFCGSTLLTVSGAETAVKVCPKSNIAQSANTTIVAEKGGKFENQKWGFSDNGGYHFVATNAGSEVTLSLVAWNDIVDNYTFEAYDGGKVSVSNGGSDLNFRCNTQTYVADGGTLNLTGIAITDGTPALTAGGSGTMTLKSINATASGTTVTLKPDMNWNATAAHITTTGGLTLGGSVAYTVDVTGLSGLRVEDGEKKMAVAQAGGTLGYTAGTVTLTGTGTENFSATLSAENNKTLYVTVKRTHYVHATGSGAGAVNVRVPAEWAANKGVTKEAELDDNGANGMKKWESYVLGLNPGSATDVICATPQQTAQGVNLKATFPQGTTKPTDSGVTVWYQLHGKGAVGGYSQIGDDSESDEFSLDGQLPTSGVKYFKICTVYQQVTP